MEGRPHFSFFGWSEPRAFAWPSLQKMWRVDRAFFLGSEPLFSLFPSFPLSFPLFPSFSIFLPLFYLFLPLFHSFFIFYLFFYLFHSFSSFFSFSFFALFHIFFSFHHLFHIISLYFLFSLSLSHSFSHFRWPGRGRSLAALPCLPLPHITSPLLSFLNTFFFFFLKKKGASRFSANFCAE